MSGRDAVRERVAEALASAFTCPGFVPTPGGGYEWVERPADRLERGMSVTFTAADGERAIRWVSPNEAAEAVVSALGRDLVALVRLRAVCAADPDTYRPLLALLGIEAAGDEPEGKQTGERRPPETLAGTGGRG